MFTRRRIAKCEEMRNPDMFLNYFSPLGMTELVMMPVRGFFYLNF